MTHYVPVLTYFGEKIDHNSIIGGIYTTEKDAVKCLIEIVLTRGLVSLISNI